MSTSTMNAQDGAHAVDGRSWRGPQVCSLAGISYRQLDYWARTGVVVPSIADARGSGTHRLYTTEDVAAAAVVRRLTELGVRPSVLRGVIGGMQSTPIAGWPDWCVVTRDGSVVELVTALTAESGDVDVCWLLNLRRVVADVVQRAADLAG